MADDDSTKPDEGEKPDEAPDKPDDKFKSEESKSTVLADLKAERTKRQQLEARLKEIEDKDKSETERLTERLTAAEKRALDAARYEVALDKGLTRSQAKRLVGNTPEELAADADELLSDLGTPETKPTPTRKPTERLRGGGEPDTEPEETDTRKIGERMFQH